MSDEDTSTTHPENAGPDPADVAGAPARAEQLGEAGIKALASMKKDLAAARLELAELRAANGDPRGEDSLNKRLKAEREKLRDEALTEAREAVLVDRALDRIEARARQFADPEDARMLLGSRVEEFVKDGKVDTDAIDKALSDLLEKKPHLAAATAKRFQGGADGGARKGSQATQLTEQDLKRMSPEQIVKAREDGRLTELLGTT